MGGGRFLLFFLGCRRSLPFLLAPCQAHVGRRMHTRQLVDPLACW